MKIGLLGKGTVGTAVYEGLKFQGHHMSFYDPAYTESQFQDILDTDIVFLCVPTEQASNGDCDISIVESVTKQLNEASYQGIVAIKSTVIPGTTESLQKLYPKLRMAMVPEFLRAKTALADFVYNHDLLVIGTNSKQDAEIIKEAHGKFPEVVSCVTPTEAEVIKYFNNVHHAMSITFANITYDVCEKLGADYRSVYDAITQRKCFNPAYLMSNENMRGFGGHCLPKDTNAWNNLIKKLNLPYTLIQSVLDDNEKVIK